MLNYHQEFQARYSPDSELSSLFFHLKKTLERKSSLFWHIQAFDRYIKADINPVGLWVQIFPTISSTDNVFKKAWENNLKACSKVMMTLLSGEYNKQMTKIRSTN